MNPLDLITPMKPHETATQFTIRVCWTGLVGITTIVALGVLIYIWLVLGLSL